MTRSESRLPDGYAVACRRNRSAKDPAAVGLRSGMRGIAALALLAAFALPAAAQGRPMHGHPEEPASPVACTDLATNPAHGLAGNPVVKSATSQIIAASGPNVAHCRVDLLYS